MGNVLRVTCCVKYEARGDTLSHPVLLATSLVGSYGVQRCLRDKRIIGQAIVMRRCTLVRERSDLNHE